jgi:hypothetical protein
VAFDEHQRLVEKVEQGRIQIRLALRDDLLFGRAGIGPGLMSALRKSNTTRRWV